MSTVSNVTLLCPPFSTMVADWCKNNCQYLFTDRLNQKSVKMYRFDQSSGQR